MVEWRRGVYYCSRVIPMSNLNFQNFKFSIIMPAYNEAGAIKDVLEKLKAYLNEKKYQTEIIVVNDGSTDKTDKILKVLKDIKLISHPYNKGYGASLKTGAKNAQYDWLLFYDSDGQHQPKYIEELIKYRDEYDMIVGARIGYQGPLIRRPGKRILRWLANYLAEQKIPDLNSGFRLIKKDLFLKFSHILPNGFSLSTTITLAFFKEGLNVKYAPITINKREGKSSLKIQDGFKTIILIFSAIILFSPLRIFLPVSVLIFGLALLSFVLDIFLFSRGQLNIGDITILLFIFSLFFFLFGLLADQISAIRREGR